MNESKFDQMNLSCEIMSFIKNKKLINPTQVQVQTIPPMLEWRDVIAKAPTGTGKTFAIEHIFLRLCLEPSPPLSIHEILVVTFTRTATRQLKQRIYANMEKIQKSMETLKRTNAGSRLVLEVLFMDL